MKKNWAIEIQIRKLKQKSTTSEWDNEKKWKIYINFMKDSTKTFLKTKRATWKWNNKNCGERREKILIKSDFKFVYLTLMWTYI